ncbi:MAG: DUF262 domain-containing protein [Bacteroidaceae bacterium]|nr:DUF262 domain-containing protein [Bacteroidaceae bacterium]
MSCNQNRIDIISVSECLKLNLSIPEYQRPYKWSVQSIDDMLWDINNSVQQSFSYSNYKYRIGTIILHKTDDVLNVVDGQQRLISLTLISKYLDHDYDNAILRNTFYDKITQKHIHDNYIHIKEWFSLRDKDIKESFKKAFLDILELVVIQVGRESEAFQLFDSQNTRGRALDPHDLLKAFHLREMQNDKYEMEYAVTKWEAKDVHKIRELFSAYLFPIWNWSRGTKTWKFTDHDIDTYKGIPSNSTYTYARRAGKASPYFQLTEPFIAGSDFFDLVDHYLRTLENIKHELATNPVFELLRPFCLPQKHSSVGLTHVRNLFFAVVFYYYDKFHNMDELSIKKLFMWSFMLRMDLSNLGADSVNKYAIGEWSGNYTNYIPVFSKISLARLHTEIGNLQIEIDARNLDTDEQKNLYELLKKMRGYDENK